MLHHFLSIEFLLVLKISEIDGINCESIALYQMQLKDHNINGKVLAACDLNELRDALQMAFGDWQLFKAWILSARTREQASSTRYLHSYLIFNPFSLLFSSVIYQTMLPINATRLFISGLYVVSYSYLPHGMQC